MKKSPEHIFTVAPEQSGERLDKFLVSALPEMSRSALQRLIKNNGVTVNNKTVSVHHFLKSGDVIASLPMHTVNTETAQETSPSTIPEPTVIFENDDFMVLDKPAGLLAHESEGSHSPALTDFLLRHYPPIAKVGEDPARPGIVHRLDKDVSGVMVVAKTQDAFDALKRQFRERKVKKIYTALAHGAFSKPTDTIDFPIERAEGGKMAARPKGSEGKRAVTEFEVLKAYHHYTLLRLNLLTGRTHQIRVHLFAYGNPIVGDTLYRRKKTKPEPLGRVFLHATELSFTDLQGKWQTFTSPLPQKLETFLTTLKEK